MQKYLEMSLKIGEQYMQWIALGLGALYLILMGIFYVAQPPITVELDRKSYLPSEIDGQIYTRLTSIQQDIKSKAKWVNPNPANPVSDLKTAFVDRAPPDVPTIPAVAYVRPGSVPETQPTVAAPTIVKAPAAEPSTVAPSMGTSVINVPQPAPAAGAAPAAGNGTTPLDRDWVTLAWTVNAKALDNAFQAAHIPNFPNVYQTAFLRVELVRQELLANNKVGPEWLIPDITTVQLQPLPAESLSHADKAAFLSWAAGYSANILAPPFFDVGPGTKWYAPGTPRPDDVFAPPAAAPGVAQPAPQPVAPRAGPGLGIAGPGGFHGGLAPVAPPGGHVAPGPAVPRAFQPAAGAPTAAAGPAPMPVATGGFFNPAQPSPDITIYTHDWTIEPGHSYHYKIRYWISNPLFPVQQVNVKPEDYNLLAIKSPYSAWSGAVDVPSRYRFWVQKYVQRNSNNEVIFDLFTKKPGAPGGLEHTTIRVTPGDTIGASPWLLVDVRQDSRKLYYFLIADPAGHIERHELDKDKNDPDHVDMLERTGATAAAGGG